MNEEMSVPDGSDRNRGFEQQLETVLRDRRGAGSAACVDAERLAAWVDGSLDPVEVAEIDAHVADCARCQTVVAALARAEPAPVPSVVPFAQKSKWRWVAPVAIGSVAAAILIWTTWPQRQASVPDRKETARLEPAVPQAARPPVSSSPVDELKMPAATADTARASTAQGPRVAQAPKPQGRAIAAEPPAPSPAPTPTLDALSASSPTPPPAAPAPAPQSAVTLSGAQAAPAPTGPPAVTEQVTVQAAGGVSAGAGRAAGQSPSLPLASREVSAGTVAIARIIEIVPPEATTPAGAGGRGGGGRGGLGFGRGTQGQVRWRILPSGSVERTADAGVSWQSISIDPQLRVTGGAASSPAVCWLIGPNGVVLRTIDGVKFDLVAFPEATTLSSIRVSDGDHATVTTADGRTFTTTDGGASWQRLQGFFPTPF
jgi:hypothetical protein